VSADVDSDGYRADDDERPDDYDYNSNLYMVATCAAVGGPAYVPHVNGLPQWGLTSVRPMRPAVVSQSVILLGSFPRVWAGPATRHAEFGNFEAMGICVRPQ